MNIEKLCSQVLGNKNMEKETLPFNISLFFDAG